MHVVVPETSFVVERRPRVERYVDAFATPFTVARTDKRPRERLISGALYSSTGDLIPLSQRISGHAGDVVRLVDPLTINLKPSQRVSGRGLYIGHFFNHYGHFITEGLGALWPINPQGPKYDYYAVHPFLFGTAQPPWMTTAFNRLRLAQKKLRVISGVTLFEDITIPERAWVTNFKAHQTFLEVVDRIAFPPKNKRLQLYLSRRNIKNRPVANEELVESVFAEHGYKIIHPQELALRDQLLLYAGADVIAGFAGSQIHNVLFCAPGTLVISIFDGHRHRAVPNQIICNALRGSTMIVVPFSQCADGFDVATLAPLFSMAQELLPDRC